MGANMSSSTSTLLNTLKASIESSQKNMVNTSTSVYCSNVQELVGINGCSVNFAEQTCSLDAVTRSTSNMSLLNSVSQDVMQSLKNQAAAESSGLPIGINHSKASAFTSNMMDVAQRSAQSLGTNCSRDASAVNVQSFRDSSCTEKNIINFAAQKASLSLVSDCVATQAASNTATQKVTSLIDNASSATSKGVDMFAFFGIFIMVMGFFLFFPVLKRFVTGISSSPEAQKAAELPPSTPPDVRKDLEDRRNAKSTVAYLLMGLIAMVLLFWPGLGAGLLGIWPWPSKLPTYDGQQTCLKGDDGKGFVAESSVINKFGFTDPMCTTGDKNQQECKTIVSYKECGIFSGKCDDPEYVDARDNFEKAVQACGSLTNSPFEYCRSQDISNVLFAREYPECKRCEDDPSNPLWHSHVGKDKSCDPSQIDLFTYMGTVDQGCQGGAELGYCLDSKDALLRKSPNDCTDPGYQIRKKQLSQYLRACEQVKATSRIKSDLVSARCPPPMSAYFTKCSTDTYKCKYVAKGCECDSAGKCDCSRAIDKEAVGACQNDFTNCLDPDYIMDVKFHSAVSAKCADVREQESTANFVGPAVFGSIYVLMVLAMVYFAFYAFRTRSSEAQVAYQNTQIRLARVQDKEQLVPVGRYKMLLALLVLLLFIFIPPTGLIAVANRMPPLWDGDKTKNNATFDGIDKLNVTALQITGYIGAALCVVAMMFCAFKIFSARKQENKAQNK